MTEVDYSAGEENAPRENVETEADAEKTQAHVAEAPAPESEVETVAGNAVQSVTDAVTALRSAVDSLVSELNVKIAEIHAAHSAAVALSEDTPEQETGTTDQTTTGDGSEVSPTTPPLAEAPPVAETVPASTPQIGETAPPAVAEPTTEPPASTGQ